MRDLSNVSWALAFALSASASNGCEAAVPLDANTRCEVINGEKLPPESGGVAEMCAAIERAASAAAPNISFKVEVRVSPRSVFSAYVTLPDGRKLPPLQMAETDRAITKSTLDRFGRTVADYVVNAKR